MNLPAFTSLPHCPHCHFLHSSLHHSHTHFHISKALCKPGCVSCMNTSGWCNGLCSDILPFLEWPVVQVESLLWWVGSCHWNSDDSHVGVGQKDFASFQLLGTTPYFGPEHVQCVLQGHQLWEATYCFLPSVCRTDTTLGPECYLYGYLSGSIPSTQSSPAHSSPPVAGHLPQRVSLVLR